MSQTGKLNAQHTRLREKSIANGILPVHTQVMGGFVGTHTAPPAQRSLEEGCVGKKQSDMGWIGLGAGVSLHGPPF